MLVRAVIEICFDVDTALVIEAGELCFDVYTVPFWELVGASSCVGWVSVSKNLELSSEVEFKL